LMLIFSVEFVYLRDAFGSRMNTVFKFYFQAWALLGLVAAFGVYYVLDGSRPPGRGLGGRRQAYGGPPLPAMGEHGGPPLPVMGGHGDPPLPAMGEHGGPPLPALGGHGGPPLRSALGRAAFGALCALFLFAGLLYPLGASISRTDGFAGPPTLDGTAFVARDRPEEHAAIRWLNENVPGNPVIVEAVRGSFAYEHARISSRTGLPAVMGWTGHEGQWHGLYDEIAEREQDVNLLYRGSVQDARRIMDKYGVTYVFVGYLERAEFGSTVEKFGRFMDVAFRDGDTVIYKRK